MASFFNSTPANFEQVSHADGIDATPFLDACAAIVPFFDLLGSTAFSPVKSDINGNIGKLRKHLTKNPEAKTLQALVQSEIDCNTTTSSGSATDALLWLKRALTFIDVFMERIGSGEKDIKAAATAAYEASLKKYHGFMVKGIFSMAMSVVPSWNGFIKACRNGTEDAEEDIVGQIKNFGASLKVHLDIINKFYAENNLDS